MLNTRTNKIVVFLGEDTTLVSYQAENSSRWLSPDPLTEKFPNYSPYAYCNNSPIVYFDPDGKQGIAGPRLTYLRENLNSDHIQSVGKNALRYFTPIEDIYASIYKKDFDGGHYNQAFAIGMAAVGVLPYSNLSKLFKLVPTAFNYSDEVAKLVKATGRLSSEAIEIFTITKSGTFRDAKTVATDILGDMGDNVVNYTSTVDKSPFLGKVVGKQSADGKKYWRIDVDAATEGAHINWVNGKQKGSIPFSGGYENAKRIIVNEIVK